MSAPFRARSRVRRVIGRDITAIEHEEIKTVSRPFRAVQTTFDRGGSDNRNKACAMLMDLALSFGKSERPSFHLRIVETVRVMCRAMNCFGISLDDGDPGFFDRENLERYNLCDAVMIAVVLDPLGYPYREFFEDGQAPYISDGGSFCGEFKPGYNDDDVQIRFARLQALIQEYGADQNMTPEQVNILLARCYPALDRNDKRHRRYCNG